MNGRMCLLAGVAMALSAAVATPEFRIWPNVVEDAPTVTVHLPPRVEGKGPCAAFLIFPGGGYRMLCDSYEGHDLAKWFNRRGIAGIVLKYRLAPKYDHRATYADAERAMRYARFHAAEWNIDPKRIGVIGFSAGGHLAGSLATLAGDGESAAADPVQRLSARADYLALVYPYVSMGQELGHEHMRRDFLGAGYTDELVRCFSADLQITERTPAAFIAHARTDKVVDIRHSRNLVAAMKAKGRPVSYLELPRGEHGLGAGKGEDWNAWLTAFDRWLDETLGKCK